MDRSDAGRQLAAKLTTLRRDGGVVVLGLPRGGVPVAYEVAVALGAPLDVLVVRKIGVPYQPELAMGAIGEGGVVVVDSHVMRATGVSDSQFAAVEQRERAELERRVERFRDDRPLTSLFGRTAVIVDDGVATGSTARAACRVARALGAARVVLAVPVAANETLRSLRGDADELVSLIVANGSFSVGQWYERFDQTTDDEVIACLRRAARRDLRGALAEANLGAPARRDDDVVFDVGPVRLRGHLTVPEGASGVVVFVHGSGSSRLSPRNRRVAESLNTLGLATLLFDLLTIDEEADRANVFNVGMLATRLIGATAWLETQIGDELPLGYFGASTGAAAALVAAAQPASKVVAVVARGGRVDLAGDRLAAVRAATLMIVGGDDPLVLALNSEAMKQMTCECRLEIVEGATHLFEEPGAMNQVMSLAGKWFSAHLAPLTRVSA